MSRDLFSVIIRSYLLPEFCLHFCPVSSLQCMSPCAVFYFLDVFFVQSGFIFLLTVCLSQQLIWVSQSTHGWRVTQRKCKRLTEILGTVKMCEPSTSSFLAWMLFFSFFFLFFFFAFISLLMSWIMFYNLLVSVAIFFVHSKQFRHLHFYTLQWKTIIRSLNMADIFICFIYYIMVSLWEDSHLSFPNGLWINVHSI